MYIEMLAMTQMHPAFVEQVADVAQGRVSLRGAGGRGAGGSGGKGKASSCSSSSSSSSSRSQDRHAGHGGDSGEAGQELVVGVEKAREYLAAARQIENLMCTWYVFVAT